MIDKEFRDWLVEVRKMQLKSSMDVLSRCRRVERIFNISLFDEFRRKGNLERIRERLRSESSSYVKPGTKKLYIIPVLARAVKLFEMYLQES